MRIRHTTLAAYLLVLVALCDQLSKYWIYNNLMVAHRGMRIAPFLNFDPTMNKGITFGLLNHFAPQAMPGVLAVTACLILILLGRWLMRTSSTLIALCLGAIMGGAIGNIIDRVRYGGVIDFLDFYYRDYHWYAFNVADAAIVTGVSLLVLDSLVRGR